jgi:cell division protein FtsZ
VLLNAVKGISDLITIHGLINVDFADVRTIMTNMGVALMGTGSASGEGRARLAARQAVESPLLEDVSIDGATGILINITGGPNMTLAEVTDACSLIQEAAHEDANIIFGSVIDDAMDEVLRITIIATGFAGRDSRRIEKMNESRPMQRSLGLTTDHRTEPALPRMSPPRSGELPRTPPTMSSVQVPTATMSAPRPPSQPGLTPPRPVRHLSKDELRRMTGIDEEELDIPTYLRHGE